MIAERRTVFAEGAAPLGRPAARRLPRAALLGEPARVPRRDALMLDPLDAWAHDRRRRAAPVARRARCLRLVMVVVALVALAGAGAGALLWLFHGAGAELSERAARLVVERIIQAESNGDPNAKNPRSTATGAGQFIEATWLELIRKHRSDLARRSESEILDLRRDPALAREMTQRLIERNAALLRSRRLPITPGTLYLSHFAGGAGAAAILTVPEDADAAATMAEADASGRTSREKLVKANPFLANYTAGALKKWADRKMRGGRS